MQRLRSTHSLQNSLRHLSSLPHHHLLSLLSKHPTSHPAIQQVHSYAVTSGLLCHPTPSYMQLFNIMLRSYSLGHFPQESFLLFKHLQGFPFLQFDSFTYSFLFKACSNLYSTIHGVQLHALTVKVGFQFHVYVQTALLHMYAACGSLADAFKVFDDMPERNPVTWNVMITALTKWGELELARLLFDKMTNRTVVTWTTVIDGYARAGRPNEAIHLFRKMVVRDGIQPTEITMLAIFPAISNLGALKICQSVHADGEKRGFYAYDIRVTNSLLDLYAKCGCIKSASRFFESISAERKNLVSWTSIISAFAMHGMGKEAVRNFERMEAFGFEPNRVTFLSVLSACSHGGLVDEGLKFFEKMVKECRVAPDIKHYGCLVDMLGREGRLEEAEKIALEIPADIVSVVIWRTLLGACSFHGNVEMGQRATRKIMEMERGYGGDYTLMSNIFAGVGRYEDAERLRKLMDDRNAFKVPGLSLV